MKLQIQKVHPDAITPTYATDGSSGFDLYSVEEFSIYPGSRAVISTGISINIPRGFEVQVRSRSGLAATYGVAVLNSPGTIDSDYTGVVKIILKNHGDDTFKVYKGDRIAQGVLAAVCDQASFEVVDAIDKQTDRGAGGFGSTGIGAMLSDIRDENGFIQPKGVTL